MRSMDTPRPLILLAIQPNTWPDEEKLRHGLRQITVDDPTISVSRVEETQATVIGAIGEAQLEVIVDRLAREFGVEARVGRPRVAYTEALTRPADGEMKYAADRGARPLRPRQDLAARDRLAATTAPSSSPKIMPSTM